jgi:hypothetical protein
VEKFLNCIKSLWIFALISSLNHSVHGILIGKCNGYFSQLLVIKHKEVCEVIKINKDGPIECVSIKMVLLGTKMNVSIIQIVEMITIFNCQKLLDSIKNIWNFF